MLYEVITTDEKYYLVRMTTQEAKDIIFADDDYDDDGILKETSKEEFADKYAELDYINDSFDDDDDDFKDEYDDPADDDDDDDDDD